MLRRIVEAKREEVARLHASTTLQSLLDEAKHMPAPRGFRSALADSTRPVSVIAEVKKASPSKGVIRPDFDPVGIARSYASAGAECISVLTDEPFFQGKTEYLRNIRTAVDQPLLRKDFIIDEWQIAEARACGADCVLLIAAIMEGEQLRDLSQAAEALGMDVLIEVHDRRELEMVFRHVTPMLIGINNRDLRTFRTDLAVTREVAAEIPSGVLTVSESGISSPADVEEVRQAGARAILVGEHFMRHEDVGKAVIQLVGEREGASPQVRS